MTPTREQLAELLEEVKRLIYHQQPAEEDNARKKLDHVIACFAALPPPAAPPHDCEAWRLEGLGCARCNKADPPALVALVREAQRLYSANITREADADELTAMMEAYNRAIDAVLAYPLPAARQHVRVESEGWGGRALRIGHITKNQWFDPAELADVMRAAERRKGAK